MNTKRHRLFVFSFLSTISLFTNTGCIDTGIRHTAQDGEGRQASTLQEAREAVAKKEAKFALELYKGIFKANPNDAESAYVLAGAAYSFDFPEMRQLKNPQPGFVLTWLQDLQFKTRPLFRFIQSTQEKYFSQTARLQFAPIEMGMDGVRLFFDPATYGNLRFASETIRTLTQLGQSVRLTGVENLDRKLVDIRRAVWKRPECHTAKNHLDCANEIMSKSLALFHDTEAPQHGQAFTLSDNAGLILARNAQKMVVAARSFFSSLARRPKLGTDSEFLLRSPGQSDLGLMRCLAGPCTDAFSFDEKRGKILMDIPGFLKKLATAKDLRVLFPTRLEVISPNTRASDSALFKMFIRGLEFKDPSFSGLFPEGDLLEKAAMFPDSQVAQFVYAYCRMMTEWVFDAN